jgi:hypothetical protein
VSQTGKLLLLSLRDVQAEAYILSKADTGMLHKMTAQQREVQVAVE